MYDNKVRLSQDVLEKASVIASEWGLKNARAAVEAVFRKYADDYLGGSQRQPQWANYEGNPSNMSVTAHQSSNKITDRTQTASCEALDALDDLLGL